MKKTIKFIKVPSEISAGTRGASLGPDAIKIASLNNPDPKAIKYFNRSMVTTLDRNNLLLDPDNDTKYRWAKRIDGLNDVYRDILLKVVPEVTNPNIFPIVLAGDHGTATATIKAVSTVYPREKVGVIWIDAHGDLHSPYTTPSGNMHGMTLALALGENNEGEIREREEGEELKQETKDRWEELKKFYGDVINYDQIVMVGLRDTEIEEKKLLRDNNVSIIPVRTMREEGYDTVGDQIIQQLEENGCTRIYISLDVDCLDQTISRGTGTPVIDGFGKWEVIELLNYLLDYYNKHERQSIECLEIVEVNPTLDDKRNKMAEVAFETLFNITNAIENNKVVCYNRENVTDY